METKSEHGSIPKQHQLSEDTSSRKAEPVDVTHVEHMHEEEDGDFKWDYDVLTNLAALYLMFFACTWAQSVPASSIVFIIYEYPTDFSTITWVGAAPSLILCCVQIFLGELS